MCFRRFQAHLRMAESGKDLTNCPVCCQEYKAKGDHVPRFLPCSHTVCEKCINRKLFRKGHLDCPQCGESHSVPDGMESLSVNRYILMFLKNTSGKKEEKDLCAAHNKEKNLFCKDPGCQTPICVLCLKQLHKNHDFGDLEDVKEQRCRMLVEDVASLQKTLQSNKKKLMSTQSKLKENYQSCIDRINNNKNELVKVVNKRAKEMIKDICDHKSKFDTNLGEVVAKIDENLDNLGDLSELVNDKEVTHKEINNSMWTVHKMRIQLETSFFKVKSCWCFNYLEKNEEPAKRVENLYSHLEAEEKPTRLFKIKRVPKGKEYVDLPETVTENQRTASKRSVPVSEVPDPEDAHHHDSDSGERRASKKTTVRDEDKEDPPPKKLRISKPGSSKDTSNFTWTSK